MPQAAAAVVPAQGEHGSVRTILHDQKAAGEVKTGQCLENVRGAAGRPSHDVIEHWATAVSSYHCSWY